jgi:DNA-binding LytR/AlgR family response regulator
MELEDTGLVRVVAWATTSEAFLEKVKATEPDILVLDIDLNGDGMNGVEVASILKRPVLFVSGKMAEYYEGVSGVDVQLKNVPVTFITKPATQDKLNAKLPKFIQQVRALAKAHEVQLRLRDEGVRKIVLDSIVYLCAEKNSGSGSGNKEVHFIDRKPGVLVDFSFTAMEEKGFPKEQFLTIHKSYRVNATHVQGREGEEILVKAMDAQGRVVEKRLPISENYRPAIRTRYQ